MNEPLDPRPSGSPTSALTTWRGFTLNDFQVRAIEALRAGRNVLVGAPTGAGKTLVAEYAVHDAVQRGKRCIYTAPIKALSNQKYRDFRDEVGFDVGLLTGDVSIEPRAQVLVMTTEILRNAIFDAPEELADVEFAIFDEVHFLDDPERGSVWEEALIFAPETMRFVCLSATVPNIAELGAWLARIRRHELEVIESHSRPVPLHHHLFHPRRGVFDLGELPRVRRELKSSTREEPGRSRRRRRQGSIAPLHQRLADETRATERLLDELERERLLPALVFAFSRKDCERLARRNATRELLARDERARMQELQDQLVAKFQLAPEQIDGELMSMARRGLGYHHAGMLPIDKELVERMFTSGLLKLLFTTETFALGINMPARSVVFHALEKFDGTGVDYLRCREYQQMAGRAGRQGIDREGLVFSVIDERDLREAPLERILTGSPEPVRSRFRLSYSSLLHLLPALSRERLHEAWDKSFQHFQLRGTSDKERDRNRRKQRTLVDAHLGVLDELGYLERGDRLTPRGELARAINGYELQVTELLFQGALEHLDPEALAVVFVALCYEERRRNVGGWHSVGTYNALRKRVSQIAFQLAACEAEHGIPTPLRQPDWGLTPAVAAWCDGRGLDELESVTDVGAGDLVRTFRMAVQLLRQVRRVLDPAWDVRTRIDQGMALLNRGEVDARRQLELG